MVWSLCFSLDEMPIGIWQEIMLEFRAGKMFFEGKRVVPDTRKGLVRIARVCFSWISFDSFLGLNILLDLHVWSLNIILHYFTHDCHWFFIVIAFVSGWGGTSSFSVAWSHTKCCWRCILCSPQLCVIGDHLSDALLCSFFFLCFIVSSFFILFLLFSSSEYFSVSCEADGASVMLRNIW